MNTFSFSPLQGKRPSASNLSETKLSCQGTQSVFEGTLLILPNPHSLDHCPGSSSPISVLSLSLSGSPLWDLNGPFPQLSGPPSATTSPSPRDISDNAATFAPIPGPLGNLLEGWLLPWIPASTQVPLSPQPCSPGELSLSPQLPHTPTQSLSVGLLSSPSSPPGSPQAHTSPCNQPYTILPPQ